VQRERADPRKRIVGQARDRCGGGQTVATRALGDDTATLTIDDEHDLQPAGFLVFRDPPRADAADALERLPAMGVRVKLATGHNARVAEKVCTDRALISGGTLTGAEIDGMDDEQLAAAAAEATIFARISPEPSPRWPSSRRASCCRSPRWRARSASGPCRWPSSPS
jgi:P-type Mg2+ transporter